MDKDTLLQVKNLKKYFPIYRGLFKKHIGDVKAVDDVSLDIRKGETLGLVGESGCGKTTTGRAILRAIEPTDGEILLRTEDGVIDISDLGRQELRNVRKRMQMIFQDPYSSLNPRMTVQEIVAEPLICYEMGSSEEIRDRVAELLTVVGLDPVLMSRYPHAFSGGQRQRIGIARALALNPDLIVADEAVSALDVSIQAQVLNLLEDLQEQYDLTYLFISHDLGVVEHICDRVAVMYVGKLVELADTEQLFHSPKHPYVEALLSSVPRPDPRYKLDRVVLRGEVADPSRRPSGCAFHPRCKYAQARCKTEEPVFVNLADKGETPHMVACHLAEELKLRGVGSAARKYA
ncbi:MAG: ATP-binding cassette domain-containing protein [Firmicutes bacterium]|nr:ATP-binding cassette domain-containing protein [Bacillota bacterium]